MQSSASGSFPTRFQNQTSNAHENPNKHSVAETLADERQHSQSLPTSNQARTSLWKAVRGGINAAAVLRSKADGSKADNIDNERIDEEGMSIGDFHFRDSNQRRRPNSAYYPAKHTDQWQNLAHLGIYDEHESSDSNRNLGRERGGRNTSASRANQPSPLRGSQSNITESSLDNLGSENSGVIHSESQDRSSRSPTIRNTSPSIKPNRNSSKWKRFFSPTRSPMRNDYRSSKKETSGSTSQISFSTDQNSLAEERQEIPVNEEPMSFISTDPDLIPKGQDPLAYVIDDQDLLDEDSDEESESEDVGGNGANDGNASTGNGNGEIESKKTERLRKFKDKIHELVPETSSLTKGIIKCVVAYFIGSLFTFSPMLSSFVGSLLPDQDPDSPISNLHMVATIAVYYHPAKTLGAMIEADIYVVLAFLYAVFIAMSSMATASYLHDQGLEDLSNVLIPFVFVGLAMGAVGWAKIKINRPTFNTACSMIGIIVFTVVVKEGSAHLGHFNTDKTLQVTLVVFIGAMISNLVCFILWPQSACTNLQNDVQRNLQGFATLLKVLTKTFLLDDPSNFHFNSDKIKRAIDDHHSSFTSLKKNLSEAKLETPFDPRIRGNCGKYQRVVDSLNRLAQHLTGLRSSCGLQHDIVMRQQEENKNGAIDGSERVSKTKAERIAEALNANADYTNSDMGSSFTPSDSIKSDKDFFVQANAYQLYLDSIGPHMRSLVFTCCRTLRNLRTAFVSHDHVHSLPNQARHGVSAYNGIGGGESGFGNQTQDTFNLTTDPSFDSLSQDLRSALSRFRHEQTIAVKHVYTIYPDSEKDHERFKKDPKNLGGRIGDDGKNKPDEEIFVVFFFMFNLDEFARELEELVVALEEIRAAEQSILEIRSWGLFQRLKWNISNLFSSSSSTRRRDGGGDESFARTAAKLLIPSSSSAKEIAWPSSRSHQKGTQQTQVASTFKQKLSRFVWTIGEILRQPDTKFSIKAGVGCAILAIPAFMHSLRPTFVEYKGQWALVSFMVVLSTTVGQSNQMSIDRILGTTMGAVTAYVVYTLFTDNNVVLPIFGALFSIPCFQYIVGKPQYASSGRFVLLAYNLTALYSYNLRKLGTEVEEIAVHRSISVTVGVLWATILNQLVWPFEARRELAGGLSDLLFKLAWFYQSIVLSYSDGVRSETGREAPSSLVGTEQQPLLQKGTSSLEDDFQAMELHLQVLLIKLEGLLAQTKHEPRLKGPFPVATYRALLSSCQSILDKLHSLRCVTGRDAWPPLVDMFLTPVSAEHRNMVGNVLLYFYTIGSAFRLKSPIPPYLPPASEARLRMLDSIRHLPVIKRRTVRGSSEYLLFYSYALAEKGIERELDLLGELTQENFGVLGGSRERFERQFRRAVERDPVGIV